MDVITCLKPGQPGTLKLLREHGRALVCVRYRVDVLQRKRYKTVELIVSEQDWYPPAPAGARNVPGRYHDAREVLVRASYTERDLHARMRAVGGKWLPDLRLWRLPRRYAIALGLRDRIVQGGQAEADQGAVKRQGEEGDG